MVVCTDTDETRDVDCEDAIESSTAVADAEAETGTGTGADAEAGGTDGVWSATGSVETLHAPSASGSGASSLVDPPSGVHMCTSPCMP